MCLLAVYFQGSPRAPLLLAAHRDEFFDRPSHPPSIFSGPPKVVCGSDLQAGGTWLGVNQHGVVVAVTNRPLRHVPVQPHSRGLLCRELLACRTAADAADLAVRALGGGRYAGANFFCADRTRATVVCFGEEARSRHAEANPTVSGNAARRIELPAGLHLLSAGDPDDRHDARQQRLRSAIRTEPDAAPKIALDELAKQMSPPAVENDPASLVVRFAERGTVSSTLLAITRDAGEAVYCYAPGPPDQVPYRDHSPLLRAVLLS